MIGNNIWPGGAREKLLHIMPQCTYHADARIIGSPAALRRLGSAILAAADLKQTEEKKVEMMASDGEGYRVVISPMSDQQIDTSLLPYAQLGQSWDFDRCWDCPKDARK